MTCAYSGDAIATKRPRNPDGIMADMGCMVVDLLRRVSGPLRVAQVAEPMVMLRGLGAASGSVSGFAIGRPAQHPYLVILPTNKRLEAASDADVDVELGD